MHSVKKLLVPTDFSPASARAADYAVHFAEALGADVTLLHVFAFPYDWYYWDMPELDALRASVEEHAHERLRALAERLARPTVTVDPRLTIRSSVTDGILEAAAAERSDLIVMGTTGWTGERPALGSVAEQVTRRSARPVLMVRQGMPAWSHHPRVLVPIDLSPAAAAALRLGAALVVALQGPIDVVHVLPELPFLAEYLGDEPVDADGPTNREQRLRAVERFLREHMGEGATPKIHLTEGDVVEEAARHAESERADLVVMGLSSREHVHKAERLALAIPCPVLAVPAVSPPEASAAPELIEEATP